MQKELGMGKHDEGVIFIMGNYSDSDRVNTWLVKNNLIWFIVKVKINT